MLRIQVFLAALLCGTLSAAVAQSTDVPTDSVWLEPLELATVPPEQVTRLDLRKAHQVPDLTPFVNLRAVHLGQAQIRRLPAAFARLPKLRRVYLPRSQKLDLEQALRVLQENASLRELDLSYNGLEQLPDALFGLTQLRVLNLSQNRLHRVPDEIAELRLLEELNLGLNRQLTNLSGGLFRLKRLRRLDLSKTALRSLPPAVEGLRALEELILARTRINRLPASLAKLPNLHLLDLGYFEDIDWPATFARLSKLRALRSLRLDHAELTAPAPLQAELDLDTLQAANIRQAHLLVPILREQTSLRFLNIRETNLGDRLSFLNKLPDLRYLDLSALDLKALPRSLLYLRELEDLILEYNDLGPGELTPLRKLPKLRRLKLNFGKYSPRELQSIQQTLPGVNIDAG